MEERGAKDPMIFRILYPRSMSISPAQSDDIADQANSNPRQLPLWTPIPRNPDRLAYYTRKDYLKYKVPLEEVEVFFDLVMSVFKWQPEERATIEQLMKHPWFEDRKDRSGRVAVAVNNNITTTTTTTTTREAGTTSSLLIKLGQFKQKISTKFDHLFWDAEKQKTKGPDFLWRYVWKPTFKALAKIFGVPTAMFWILMVLPAAWVIKRRIDLGGNVFFASSARGLRH